MGRIVASEYLNLDGVMQAPGDADEYEHGGWSNAHWSDELGQYKDQEMLGPNPPEALLLGRVTYEGFAKAWPTMDAGEYGARMNTMPKHVVTSTLDQLDWDNARPVRGDVEQEVTALKEATAGDLLLFGSGDLFRSLLAVGLVDEIRLQVHPVAVGGGKRLFGHTDSPEVFELRDVKQLGSGVAILAYTTGGS